MLSTLILLADAAATAQEGPTPAQSLFSTMMPLVAICLMGYLLLIRPMQKQERDRQSMVAKIKKNDRVVTSGGLIGIVASVKEKEDEITLKVDDNSNVRIKVTKSSVVRVLNAEEPSKDAKTEG